MQSLLTTV
jgi:hypothetical protein